MKSNGGKKKDGKIADKVREFHVDVVVVRVWDVGSMDVAVGWLEYGDNSL